MDISNFDMKILKNISESNDGRSPEELVEMFGTEAQVALDCLESNGLVSVHRQNFAAFLKVPDYKDPPIGNYLITKEGRAEIKRFSVGHSLTSREKWLERLWGFIAGIALTVIAWALGKLS